MSQNDMTLADAAGAAFLADLNSALAALVSNSSGATAPSTTYAYQLWADTTSGWIKQRDAANAAWIKRWPLGTATRTDIASAATLDLTANAAASDYLRITGTTGVTAVTLEDGQRRWALAGGAFTLTNSANLILQGGANYTTTAGDMLLFVGEPSSVVRVFIWKADGMAVVGGSTGAFALTGDISPAQITANQDDYNPTGLAGASVLRLSSDAARNITGLQGGSDGLVKVLHNVGGFAVTLKDESAGSTAANRFALVSDVAIQPDAMCVLQYDATSSRWRCLSSGSSSVFASSYESAEQTITAGGSLTLGHGLPGTPKILQALLKCTTADMNYAVNDYTFISVHGSGDGGSSSSSRGVSIVPDATNLNVRFGAAAWSIQLADKSTGTTGGITNASWKLILRAYY